MKKAWVLFIVLFVINIVFSCKTTGNATQSAEADKQVTDNQEQTAAEKEMASFLENGLAKLDEMFVSEGISQLIAVLAIKNNISSPSPKALELAKRAETELTKIEAGLLLSVGSDWLNDESNQITGSSIDIGKEGALNPVILLSYNIGGSRTAIIGAPILFEFKKGSGLLPGIITTNEYGQAICSVAKVDNPNSEIIIKATLVYQIRGFTYRFKKVSREFIYMPPAKKATIIVYERAYDYVAEHPYIFEPVYNTLKNLDFDFSQYNGVLIGDEFLKVFSGDLAAIKRLALMQEVSYLVMVFNDCYDIHQYSPGRDIFVAEAKATLRIIRVIDGKVMYEVEAYAIKKNDTWGAGNSEEKAMRKAFENAATALKQKLRDSFKEIDKALLGQD